VIEGLHLALLVAEMTFIYVIAAVAEHAILVDSDRYCQKSVSVALRRAAHIAC
jgi:hypothetical protein